MMRCPWCDFEGAPRRLHAHLGEVHGDKVRFEERGATRFYGIDCPICGDGYEHVIKPRLRDPAFMREFQDEIRLVAFDMLVNHLLAEHVEEADEGAGASEAAGAIGTVERVETGGDA